MYQYYRQIYNKVQIYHRMSTILQYIRIKKSNKTIIIMVLYFVVEIVVMLYMQLGTKLGMLICHIICIRMQLISRIMCSINNLRNITMLQMVMVLRMVSNQNVCRTNLCNLLTINNNYRLAIIQKQYQNIAIKTTVTSTKTIHIIK